MSQPSLDEIKGASAEAIQQSVPILPSVESREHFETPVVLEVDPDVAPALRSASLDFVLDVIVLRGNLRRLSFRLSRNNDNMSNETLNELQRIFQENPKFAYAKLLAVRHRIWAIQTDTLPSFAAAFEDALATEDRKKLEILAARQPRLEVLILVAQALLGDADAQQKVEQWLRQTETAEGARNRWPSCSFPSRAARHRGQPFAKRSLR